MLTKHEAICKVQCAELGRLCKIFIFTNFHIDNYIADALREHGYIVEERPSIFNPKDLNYAVSLPEKLNPYLHY